MATGVFVIHPNSPGVAAITCDLGEDSSVDFQVLPTRIDFHPQDRLNVLYTQGQHGGFVRKSTRGLAGFDFDIAAYGTAPAAQRANERLLVQAITDPLGGLIEWLPRGMPAGTLHTYYHYLMSSPPQAVYPVDAMRSAPEIAQPGRATADVGILYRCKLVTKAMATSDPATLVSIVANQTIDNIDDSDDDNFVIVPASSIKGDWVIPYIIVGNSTTSPTHVVMYKRSMRTGANTNLDYIEGESFTTLNGFGNTPDASASNGNYASNGGDNSYLEQDLGGLAWDSTYLGKITIMIMCKVDAATEFQAHPFLLTDAADVFSRVDPVTITNTSWHIVYSFAEIDIPPFTLPGHLDDATSPTLAEYVKDNLFFRVSFARTVGAGNIDVDFVVLAKADEWIGVFEQQQLPITNARDLNIDAITESAQLTQQSDDTLVDQWKKYGSPYNSLLMDKGHDHRLRFFMHTGDGDFDRGLTADVEIKGIYGTVYPFEMT